MTTHFVKRTFFSIALLAIFTIGTACSDDDSMKQAADKAESLGQSAEDAVGHRPGEALDTAARELTDAARSGQDALEAEASLATGVIEAEASELAEAARHGGVARAAGDASEAAQELRDQGGVEAVAKKLEKNIENSREVYGEAYRAARKRDENALEASGDAYNAVLDVPREKGSE